jgi:hypothetical protein
MAVLFPLTLTNASGKRSSDSTSSSKSTKSTKASKSEKTVHVSGYTRKDGTYVHAYDRRPSGEGSDGSLATPRSAYLKDYAAPGYTLHSSVERDSHGRIKRSNAAKDAFKRSQPCPATGKSTGGCPGYVIDHVKPLECGGPDDPSNMQWQTIADGKAKDKTERYCQ